MANIGVTATGADIPLTTSVIRSKFWLAAIELLPNPWPGLPARKQSAPCLMVCNSTSPWHDACRLHTSRAFPYWTLLSDSFSGDRNLLRLPINVCNCQGPEGNQINSRHQLAKKRWQELPVPTEKVSQHSSHSQIEYVVSGRLSARNKERENNNLQRVRDDGKNHRGTKARTRRNCDGVVSHIGLLNSSYCFACSALLVPIPSHANRRFRRRQRPPESLRIGHGSAMNDRVDSPESTRGSSSCGPFPWSLATRQAFIPSAGNVRTRSIGRCEGSARVSHRS